MTNPPTRRDLLQAALAVATALTSQRSVACEYFAPTLRVTHPWTRATPAGAEFAVLGMRFDDVLQDEQLLDVQTPVAEGVVFVPGRPAGLGAGAPSILRLPLDIPAGRETVLGQVALAANGGPGVAGSATDGATDGATGETGPHLRLLRLTQDLEAGRSYPLRLVFKQGGTVKALLNVDYARFT